MWIPAILIFRKFHVLELVGPLVKTDVSQGAKNPIKVEGIASNHAKLDVPQDAKRGVSPDANLRINPRESSFSAFSYIPVKGI